MEWEENEEKIRKHVGKNVAILKRKRNNVTRNFTLKELREEKENLTTSELLDAGGCGCFTED